MKMEILRLEGDEQFRIISESFGALWQGNTILVPECELCKPITIGRKIIKQKVKGVKEKTRTVMRKTCKRSRTLLPIVIPMANIIKLNVQKIT
jgi:hypothetical protein